MRDVNKNEIIEADYKISHVDMGPSTLEGDVYHANFSVNALIKRAKEQKKENIELQSQVQSLKGFIASIVNPVTEEASSSNFQGIDFDAVQKVKKNLGYAKAANEWIEELYQGGLLYLTKFRQLYIYVTNKRRELVAELQQVRKEHGSTYVLSKEIMELLSLNHGVLIA